MAGLRLAALAAIIANVAIIVTGSVVRITGSGLGCPDWPTCDGSSIVPRAESAQWHTFVEFGNRLMTFVVLAVAIWVVVAAWRAVHGTGQADRTLRQLAVAQVVGVLVQAVLGGVTVLTGLHPLIVAAHLLASMALVAVAVVLHDRAGARVAGSSSGSAVPASSPPGTVESPAPAPGLRSLAKVVVAAAGTVLVLGTLVTAAGPHSGGEPGLERLAIDIRTIAVAHTDAVWLLVGATVASWLVARANGAERAQRASVVLLGIEVVQGAIGYTQYALGVPPAPVVFHVLGAALVWLAAWRLAVVVHPGPTVPAQLATAGSATGPVEFPASPSR